jgi:hypothetical protein
MEVNLRGIVGQTRRHNKSHIIKGELKMEEMQK